MSPLQGLGLPAKQPGSPPPQSTLQRQLGTPTPAQSPAFELNISGTLNTGNGNVTSWPHPGLLRQPGRSRDLHSGPHVPGTWFPPFNAGNPPPTKISGLRPHRTKSFWVLSLPGPSRQPGHLQVSRALIRSFSSTARNRFQNRVPEKQKLFQEDNDIPLYLKGGFVDNILYRVTMALGLGGSVYSLYCLGWASFPRN